MYFMIFDSLVQSQWGLITWRQLLEFMTDRQARREVADGRLVRMLRSVYRLAGVPELWRQGAMAAYLAVGDPAAAGFRCAARLHGIPYVPGRPIELVVPDSMRPRLPGVTVHRSTLLPEHHVQRMDALLITTPARVICDVTARLSDDTVARILRAAIRSDLTTYAEIGRVREDIRARGRRRTTVLDRVLARRLPGTQVGDSEGEYKLLDWIAKAGLALPKQQFWVTTAGGRYCLDHAYVDEKIDIEWDSDLHEKTPDDVEYDAARDVELELAGWFVMRNSVLTERHDFVRRLTEALRQRSH